MASEKSLRERLAPLVLICLIGSVGLIALYSYWYTPPQMGTSEEVFLTVDALYTAVRSKDEKLVGQCEAKLKTQLESGKLPASASRSLESIIQTARSGSWDSAAHRLYDFMLAQRREGPMENHGHGPQK